MKIVNERLEDVLKGKSEEEFKDALDKMSPWEAFIKFIGMNYIKGVKDYFEKYPNETVDPGIIMEVISNGYVEMTDLLLNYVYVANPRLYFPKYEYYFHYLDEKTKERMKEVLKKHGYDES